MPELLVITAPGDSLGFRCAGLECVEAKAGDDISSMLLSIQAEGRRGLVVIEDRLLARVPESVMKRLKKKPLPIILPISVPQVWGVAEGEESPVVRLIRRAIGYQIKIKR
ncbi:MAG: V-type ATP synthase subunit F [Deltaproteobacteria bacterium]|nr:V-type ATP synthase subunit F [Deltaproteobacteria bacterium]